MLFVALRQGLQLLVAAHIVTTWSETGAFCTASEGISSARHGGGGAMTRKSLER